MLDADGSVNVADVLWMVQTYLAGETAETAAPYYYGKSTFTLVDVLHLLKQTVK